MSCFDDSTCEMTVVPECDCECWGANFVDRVEVEVDGVKLYRGPIVFDDEGRLTLPILPVDFQPPRPVTVL